MLVNRTEKFIVKKSNKNFKFLDDLCFKSKNLYNHGNYLIREEFFKNNNILSYGEIDKLLKKDSEHPDYRQLPAANSQQTLRLLSKNWKSFKAASYSYSKNKEKFKARPKPPKYLDKSKGRFPVIFTNQQIKISSVDNSFSILKTAKFYLRKEILETLTAISQVRIIPKSTYIKVEFVYEKEVKLPPVETKRVLGVDIGVNNLITAASNFKSTPIIIDGKGLKSMNQYYNKKLATLKSKAATNNNLRTTNRIQRLHVKRNFKIDNYLHRASKLLIDYAIKNDVDTIIVGHNKDWKQQSHLGKVNNQNFIMIPFNNLIEMIRYKGIDKNIRVMTVDESYTSGTSYLDDETPTKDYYNKTRRIKRGLFRSNSNILINADVNSAYQIIKKASKNLISRDLVEGSVINPVKYYISA